MGSMHEIADRFRVATVTSTGPVFTPPDPDFRRRLEEEEDEERQRRQNREMDASLRRMRQMAEMQALQKTMAPPPPPSDNGVATAIATMIRASNQQNQAMIAEMRTMRQDMATQQQNALLQHIQALGSRVEEVASMRNGSGTATGLDTLSDSLNQVKLFKGLIDEIAPPPHAVDPTVTREQMIKQAAIEGEIDIRRRMEDRKRREMEIGYEREKEERVMASDRIARAFDSLAQIGTPLVEGLTGAVAQRFAPGAAGNGAAPNGAAPAAIAAPNGHVHDPQASMDPWQCPGCGVTNHSPPGTNPATCANCNKQWSLSPLADEPALGSEDPYDDFVNV